MVKLQNEMGISLEDDKVKEALQGLRKLKENVPKTKPKSILLEDDEDKVMLQVTLKKIPKLSHTLALRLNLKHPIVADPKSICLIVRDRDKKKRDYEEDVAYWKELFSNKGITVGEIIPYKQLKTEYKTHEAKRNLCNGFEMFLVDAVLAPLMPNALGKSFVQKRKMPYAVNLDEGKIKKEFERAFKKSTMNVTGRGCICSCQVGYLGLTDEEITDNVKEVVKDIDKKLPGSWKNVDTLLLKTSRSMALPIYSALHSADSVVMPKTKMEEEPLEDELSTLTRSKVRVYPSGKVELVPEENDDVEELQHSELPFENHLLSLRDVLKRKKKDKKKLGSVKEVEKKQSKRKTLVQKLIKSKDLRELANFKEAEALKADRIKNKNKEEAKDAISSQKKIKNPVAKKKKSILPVGLNPFTKEAEKFIKKTEREMKVDQIEENLNTEDSTVTSPGKKKMSKSMRKKLKRKMETIFNSTPNPKKKMEDADDAKIEETSGDVSEIKNDSVDKKKRRRKGKKDTNPSTDVSLTNEKKEKLEKKLNAVQKLAKKNSNIEVENSVVTKLSKKQQKKLNKQAKLNAAGQEGNIKVKPSSPIKSDNAKSQKSSKKWSKKLKESSDENNESSSAKKSLTSGFPRIGSIKKKSYKVNSQNSSSPAKNEGRKSKNSKGNEPQLLSVKSKSPNSPKKSPMEKGSGKSKRNKQNRNVLAKMQKN